MYGGFLVIDSRNDVSWVWVKVRVRFAILLRPLAPFKRERNESETGGNSETPTSRVTLPWPRWETRILHTR